VNLSEALLIVKRLARRHRGVEGATKRAARASYLDFKR
jgi:hypothetical protein